MFETRNEEPEIGVGETPGNIHCSLLASGLRVLEATNWLVLPSTVTDVRQQGPLVVLRLASVWVSLSHIEQ